MGFYLGGLIIGRMFASEIWGGLIFGGGGLLTEFYGLFHMYKKFTVTNRSFFRLSLFVSSGTFQLLYQWCIHSTSIFNAVLDLFCSGFFSCILNSSNKRRNRAAALSRGRYLLTFLSQQVRRFFEGGAQSGAALIRVNTVSKIQNSESSQGHR